MHWGGWEGGREGGREGGEREGEQGEREGRREREGSVCVRLPSCRSYLLPPPGPAQWLDCALVVGVDLAEHWPQSLPQE